MLAMLRSNVMPPSFSLLFFFNRVLTLEQAGILLAQSCSATRVVLTDHSQDVLKTLRGNIELNKVAALAEARYLDWTEGAAAVQSLASDRPPSLPPLSPLYPSSTSGGGASRNLQERVTACLHRCPLKSVASHLCRLC